MNAIPEEKMSKAIIVAHMAQQLQDHANNRAAIGGTFVPFCEPYTEEKWVAQCETLATRLKKYVNLYHDAK